MRSKYFCEDSVPALEVGTLVIDTRVDFNFTSVDDLAWRFNRIKDVLEASGLVRTSQISAATQVSGLGFFEGRSVLISDLGKLSARKLLAEVGELGNYFSARSKSWTLLSQKGDVRPLEAPTWRSGYDPRLLKLNPESVASAIHEMTPEELFRGRGEDGLYRRGFPEISEEEFAGDDLSGNSWKETFKKHPPIKLFYLAVSMGAGQVIRKRIASSFKHEGFTPTIYSDLTEALNGASLSEHPQNIFKSTNRFGGGKQGMEWVIKPSEFRIFPRLRELGLSPVDAATAILNVTGVQEDLLTEFEQESKTRGNCIDHEKEQQARGRRGRVIRH